VVDGTFEDKAIVDGDHPHMGDGFDSAILHAVPARLASSRDGAIHDIVRDEEEGLQLNQLVRRKS